MKNLPVRISIAAADNVHDAVCKGQDVLPPRFVDREIKKIKRNVERICKRADKSYAHIERDRRRITKGLQYGDLDKAINALFTILNRYSLCLFGEEVVVPDMDLFSIVNDLRTVWPGNAPLPEFPSVHEQFDP
jgi:hypothetical protein